MWHCNEEIGYDQKKSIKFDSNLERRHSMKGNPRLYSSALVLLLTKLNKNLHKDEL